MTSEANKSGLEAFFVPAQLDALPEGIARNDLCVTEEEAIQTMSDLAEDLILLSTPNRNDG